MTTKTKRGFFVKDDKFGLEVFSPFSGLFFKVPVEDSDMVSKWLDDESTYVTDYYKNNIGWGLIDDAMLDPRLFTSKQPMVLNGHIIVINWLITGKCNFKCPYCYASDVGDVRSLDDFQKTADIILSYDPLAVVISGGEPLLNPDYKRAITTLSGKTGVILDTNGYYLDKETIKWLRDKGVVIRISLDSLIPRYNESIRMYCLEDVSKIIEAINLCIEMKATLVIHTVVTKKNFNDLGTTKEKLEYLGVKVWKLIRLVDIGVDKRFLITYDNENFVKRFIRDSLNINERMFIWFQENKPDCPNSSVLVLPDGSFRVQGCEGKVFIDNSSPNSPSYESLEERLDKWEHSRRYFIYL